MADDGKSMSGQRQVPEGDVRTGRRSRSHLRRLSASSRDRDMEQDERSSLLGGSGSGEQRDYQTVPGTPRHRLSRHHSSHSPIASRPSRVPSFSQRLSRALSNYDLKSRNNESLLEDRVWYDQVGIPPVEAQVKDAY